MRDGRPIILIEAKRHGARLRLEAMSQLLRYFTVTDARFAILTDGEGWGLERQMGFEPTTPSLARRCSTTEPLPLAWVPPGPRAAGSRLRGAEGQNRTDDTSVFSAVLYRLSYLGPPVQC